MTNMVEKAFLFALKVHGSQTRKDGKPYITHPFSVAMELARNGADDELICAGLLHDTIEDGGVSAEELKNTFGDEVLRLVLFDTEDKELSWRERKVATIASLESCDRECAMLVCADKLSNLRDIENELTAAGEAVWDKFQYGRDGQEWLFSEYAEALGSLSELEMYRELKKAAETVFNKKENKNNAGQY